MKVVLDTNVILAAFAARGLAAAVFELCVDKHDIFISEHILSELRKNFQKKLKMPEDRVAAVLEYLREFCSIDAAVKLDKHVCRDADDVKILGLAEKVHADCIVTGDDDLLVLEKFGRIRILTPRDFWELSRKKK